MQGSSIAGTVRNSVPQPIARPITEPARLDNAHIMTLAAPTVLACASEFYDFVLHGVFAVVLAAVFFPSKDPALEMLGAFGAGFVVRPLGAMLAGPWRSAGA